MSCIQVMKRLFKPRKRTLLFVIRDHSKVWNLCSSKKKRITLCSVLWMHHLVQYWIYTPFFIVYGDSIWIFGDCSQRRYRQGTFVHITYIPFMPLSFWVNCLFLPALSHNLYRYGILLLNLRLPEVLFSVIFLMCVSYHLHLHVPYSCHWHICFICNILFNWNIT